MKNDWYQDLLKERIKLSRLNSSLYSGSHDGSDINLSKLSFESTINVFGKLKMKELKTLLRRLQDFAIKHQADFFQ